MPAEPHSLPGNKSSNNLAGNVTNTSQNPRRCSRRASSVVVTPNMVTPSSNSRVRLNQPGVEAKKNQAPSQQPTSDVESIKSVVSAQSSRQKKKKKSQKPSSASANPTKKRKRIKKSKNNPVEANGTPVLEDYDYNQDTDDGSIEVLDTVKKKAKEDVYANILEYFHAPVWKTGDPPNTTLNYKCRWCHNTYRGQLSLRGNLKTHQDGSTQLDKNPHGCRNRDKAKKSGIALPPSVSELSAMKKSTTGDGTQTGIAGFLQFKPVFNNWVLNQIVMTWQIWQALPWT
ncbi:hypothetical protein PCANC_26651 [Puccinia coronata f. sp. avenae]|uniref:Uncharacterized protein n=1 Tax=Puccinia coronata f. sp. avenae TaxID=200324 RepID=A0A2N5S479_9BASI|nr:hypothetical protein PCANC_26651 [Puccinia coronata f. sp. avenae]